MDRNRINQLAANTGFQPDTLEKIIRLGELAAAVDRHPRLSSALALKGGTALNMFRGEPPRLSVDLDFNYIGAIEREEMVAERPAIERAVDAIGHEKGYAIQKSASEHAGQKLFLNYKSTQGSPDRIEIDLNYLHRLPLSTPYRDTMWQPEGQERPMLQLVGQEEVCAGKLCAMLDRYKPRDLFDANQLPKMAAGFWHTERFKRIVVAFTGTLVHPLYTYGRERLERVRDIDIRAELVPMLGHREPIDRSSLINGAWAAIEAIVTLEDSEREFVDRLQAGELRTGLLFPGDPEMADRMARWPPLVWKARNAREHDSTKRQVRTSRRKQ